MKSRFLVAVLTLATPCFAQGPAPSYYTYLTQSGNSSYLITQTVLISGTTTGSCYYTCETGTCTIPNCTNATHTPTVCNELGGTGTCTVGPAYSMFSQMNYQTTITFQAQPGVVYNGTETGSIYCTMGGASCCSGGGGTQTEFAYTKVQRTGSGTNCAYHGGVLICDWPTSSWCTRITTPPDWNPKAVTDSEPASPYWSTWGLCERGGTGLPWFCVADLALKDWTTPPAPVVTCTYNP